MNKVGNEQDWDGDLNLDEKEEIVSHDGDGQESDEIVENEKDEVSDIQGVEDEIPPETDTEVMNDENDVLGNEHSLDTDDEEEDLPDKRENEEYTPDFDFNKPKESKGSVHGIVTQNGVESIKQPDEEEIKDWETLKLKVKK